MSVIDKYKLLEDLVRAYERAREGLAVVETAKLLWTGEDEARIPYPAGSPPLSFQYIFGNSYENGYGLKVIGPAKTFDLGKHHNTVVLVVDHEKGMTKSFVLRVLRGCDDGGTPTDLYSIRVEYFDLYGDGPQSHATTNNGFVDITVPAFSVDATYRSIRFYTECSRKKGEQHGYKYDPLVIIVPKRP